MSEDTQETPQKVKHWKRLRPILKKKKADKKAKRKAQRQARKAQR